MSHAEKTEFFFVGRENELSELSSYLEESMKGNEQLILISGEAGVGKTRLVEELKKLAPSHVQFLMGRCLYGAENDPFLPFVDALRKYFKIDKKDSEETEKKKITETLRKSSPDLLQMIPIIGGILSAGVSLYVHGKKEEKVFDPAQEKNRMFETIARLMDSISKKSPIIFFLDDLHWADDSSLSLLHYIVRDQLDSKILFLGAFRPEEPGNLPEVMKKLGSEGLYKEIKLSRLSKENLAEMISKTFKAKPPEEFVSKLFKKTEGNAFFTVETLLSLKEEKLLIPEEGIFPLDFDSIYLPFKVENVVARRVSRLTEQEKKVLEYSSVIGEVFEFELLCKALEIKEEELAETLDSLIKKNLVYELAEENKLRFNHVLIQNYVYKQLSNVRAKILNKKIASTLESLHTSDLDDVASDLAIFYYKAEAPEKALEFSIKAGDIASQKFAHEEAIKHFERALHIIHTKPNSVFESEVPRIKEKLGYENYIFGKPDSALKCYSELLDSEISEKERAKVFRAIGEIKREQSEWDEAIENFNKAVEISKKLNDIEGLADAYYGLGMVGRWSCRFDFAKLSLEKSIEFGEKLPDKTFLGRAYRGLGDIMMFRGEFKKSVELLEKSIEIFKAKNDPVELARTYQRLGDTYREMEEWEKCFEYSKICKNFAEKAGYLQMLLTAKGTMEEANLQKYRKTKDVVVDKKMLIEAESCIKNVIQFAEVNNYFYIEAIGYFIMGFLYKLKKEWTTALNYFDIGFNKMKKLGIPYYLAYGHYELGWTYWFMGDLKKARVELEKSLEIYNQVGAPARVVVVENELKKYLNKH